MARSNDNLKFTGLAVVVIAAAFGVGYYVLGGTHPSAAPDDAAIAPVSGPVTAPATVAQNTPPPAISPRRKNSDYTAPGAPSIRIVEERTPSLTVTHSRPAATVTDTTPSHTDAEASQEAPPPADTTASAGDNSGTPTGGDGSASAPSAPLIPPPPTAAPVNAIPSSGVDSATPGRAPESTPAAKAQYRVQAGTFATPDNARQVSDTLRGQGYATTTRTEQDNGKTIYKVQVGAYRSRAAADKAATDLQKSGYPASTSPIGP